MCLKIYDDAPKQSGLVTQPDCLKNLFPVITGSTRCIQIQSSAYRYYRYGCGHG